MIFLTITIVLALVAAIGAVGVLVPWAKIMMAIANLFFIIAFLLVPLGFNELDDPCPTFGDQGQCGLRYATVLLQATTAPSARVLLLPSREGDASSSQPPCCAI